jgi:hypothetical protein
MGIISTPADTLPDSHVAPLVVATVTVVLLAGPERLSHTLRSVQLNKDFRG